MLSPSKPQIGVGVLIRENGRILLGKRKGSHGAGTWSPPGGHLEYAESFEACAHREALEETGLSIGKLQLGPVANNVFEAEHKHYVTIFVLATPVGGVLSNLEPDRCEGWAWFSWDQLPQPLFAPLASILEQGFMLPEQD